jgi:hypothetical protein
MVDSKMEQALRAKLPEEYADKALAALDAVTSEPAVGTVLHNAATGDVALRVGQYGQFYWRVYSPDDRTWIEQEPLVGWDVLHEEAAAVTLEGAEEVPPAK